MSFPNQITCKWPRINDNMMK